MHIIMRLQQPDNVKFRWCMMILLECADNVITYKKTVKEVAAKREMIANFMPKPIALDNGSGMHVSQSLWTKKKYGDDVNHVL